MSAEPDFEPEEPWEAEIGALLGNLPAIDPPDGFLASAVDHRPLYAGRVLVALMAAAMAAVVATSVAGLTNHSLVTPDFDAFAQRHLAAQATFATSEAAAADGEGPLVSVPEVYEVKADLIADDLRQAVYAMGGETVSVFVQEGHLDWDALPVAGRRRLGGDQAWVDEELAVTVVQAGDEIVTIVGLPSDQVAAMVAALPDKERSALDRLTVVVAALTRQLGFPGSN